MFLRKTYCQSSLFGFFFFLKKKRNQKTKPWPTNKLQTKNHKQNQQKINPKTVICVMVQTVEILDLKCYLGAFALDT